MQKSPWWLSKSLFLSVLLSIVVTVLLNGYWATPEEHRPPSGNASAGVKKKGMTKADCGTTNITMLEALVHKEINTVRRAKGLPDLAVDSRVADIARKHSEDMAKYAYFAHASRADGQNPFARLQGEGISFRMGAENIYRFPINYAHEDTEAHIAYAVVSGPKGWMYSPHHKTNILSRHSHEGIGVACIVRQEKGRDVKSLYVTQDFILP